MMRVVETLLRDAEKQDRKLGAARIEQLTRSYLFFKEAGLSEPAIKSAMALTEHEMQLIRKSL